MARRTNSKRRSDPKAPKKTRSAWQMFLSDQREEIQKENPNLTYRELVAKIGQMWRERDETTKRRYETLYQSSQDDYNEQMVAYRETTKQKRQSSKSKKNASQSQNERETSPEYADPN